LLGIGIYFGKKLTTNKNKRKNKKRKEKCQGNIPENKKKKETLKKSTMGKGYSKRVSRSLSKKKREK